ncbi:unnamed protein product [Phaedon cochleariae]|uniref:Right handed beta helix domain-containing protein n=1 Tax=Phaedon cochleariae TaxID=80249 RepID=A0A9P0DHW0_PHACE|nr:unnamed protein product [Phaedon cochleariae]
MGDIITVYIQKSRYKIKNNGFFCFVENVCRLKPNHLNPISVQFEKYQNNMEDIITFDKSLQQRYQEYSEILSSNDILPSSQLSKQWALHVEMTVENIGWQAIWKIPRLTCESLHIHFPSYVLVFVLNIDAQKLKVLVRVLAVQEDIHIPDKHWIPLIQLWPTREQEKSIALSLMQTADALDTLRFFYLYVYMPWDRDDDDNHDWREKHLESRLQFFYDLKNGVIPRGVAEHIHDLLIEARRMQNKREALEEKLNREEYEMEFQKDIRKNQTTQTLLEIHVRLQEIRAEIDILESPLLREVIIRRHDTKPVAPTPKQHIWLIFNEGTTADCISFLHQVETSFPLQKITFSDSLASKLESTNSGDIYLLNENTHTIRTIGALEKGGTLRGFGDKNRIIVDSILEDVMLDFNGDEILIENLTVDTKSVQCGILVRKGKCVISNCKIQGNGSSSTQQGIIVLAEAEVVLENCEITGFAVGVVGNSGSKITLKNCDLHHGDIGMKVFDKCKVLMSNTLVREFSEFGFVLDSEVAEAAVGEFDTLNMIPNMQLENIQGTNNMKGDAAIMRKEKLKPVEDLFSNPNLDPTIIDSDDNEEIRML